MILPPPASSSPDPLRPDPLFMILRRCLNPLTSRIDGWRDAREDRQEVKAAVVAAEHIARESTPVTSMARRTDHDGLAA